MQNQKYFKEIDAFVKAHLSLYKILVSFPLDKTSEVLFDNWSIKEVVIHMYRWNEIITSNIQSVLNNEEPKYYGSVQEFNENSTKDSVQTTWQEALNEFDKSGKNLFKAYLNFPENLFEQKFWTAKSSTPLKFLNILTKHYLEEHTPVILSVLNDLDKVSPDFAALLQQAFDDGYKVSICACIVNDSNEILLVKRSPSNEWAGIWEMPGGGVEKGEDLQAAIIREVREETGLVVSGKPVVFDYFDFYNIENGKYKRKFCLKLKAAGEVELSNEHSDFKWFSSKSLARELIPQFKDIKNFSIWDDHFNIANEAISLEVDKVTN
jgi:8-oxo-dGTP diphosphatase